MKNFRILFIVFMTCTIFAADPAGLKIDFSGRDLMQKNLAYRKDNYVPYDYYEEVILPVQAGFRMTELQRYDAARDYFFKALSRDSTYVVAYNGLGNLYMKQESLRTAEQYYRKALKYDPRSSIAYNNLGNLFMMRDDRIRGEMYLKKALALNPNSSTIYYNLGNVFLQTGRSDSAEAFYRKAIELDRSFCNARYNLALLFENRGDILKAINEYENAADLCPGHSKIILNLAAYYIENGEIDKAFNRYEQAVKINPDPEVYKALGNLYYNTGSITDSHFAYKKAVETDSLDMEAAYYLAQSYYEQNMPFSALKLCRHILEHSPAHVQARQLCDSLEQ